MDQSLDEIIQSKRKNNFNRQQQRPKNNSPIKRGRIFKRNSGPIVSFGKANEQWKHDMFKGNRSTNMKSGHKIQISNLDFGVNDEDINELFKEFGPITRAGVNYDRSGRSLGTAEVIYLNKSSAIQARNKYNGIPLDNKPMKIIVVESSALNRVGNNFIRSNNQMSNNNNQFRMNNGNNFRTRSNPPSSQQTRNNNQNNRGNRNQKATKTKEQLDAEMDEYLSKTG